MSQWLKQLIDSPLGKKLGVDAQRLERFDTSHTSFLRGNTLLGAANGGELASFILPILQNSEANVFLPAYSGEQIALEKQAAKVDAKVTAYHPDIEKDLRFKALVFDATGIKSSEELIALQAFFTPVMKKLSSCARVVVLGRTPESVIKNVKYSTAQRGLEGFTRCLAKEVGKKGVTVQLIHVEKGAEDGLRSPLEFVLSPKSAYVNAQVIKVSKTKAEPIDYDWKKPLAGKTALITGASRGIGEKIAEVFARDGATVIGLDIKPAEGDLNKVMQRINGKALVQDISTPEAPQEISDWIKENVGAIDIIVHNAGVTRDKTLARMPEHFWKMAVNINLSSEERIDEKLLEDGTLVDGGRIVCVSSVSGIAGNFGQTNYGASKAGVIGMVNALSPVLMKRNITINAVAPGFIETQMTAAIPFVVREVGQRINALKQAGQPVDVAEAIAFFASPGSANVTGNVVRVCGQSMLGA